MPYSGSATAKSVRENLGKALAALQEDPQIPPDVLSVAQNVAQAIGALCEAERGSSEVDGKASVKSAIGMLGQTLALLQEESDLIGDPKAPAPGTILANLIERKSLIDRLASEDVSQKPGDAEIKKFINDFLTEIDRTVRKDGTIRLDGRLYEVPLSLRALTIQIRFDPFSRRRIEVWHQGKFIALATPANVNLNHETGGSNAYEH